MQIASPRPPMPPVTSATRCLSIAMFFLPWVGDDRLAGPPLRTDAVVFLFWSVPRPILTQMAPDARPRGASRSAFVFAHVTPRRGLERGMARVARFARRGLHGTGVGGKPIGP